MSENKAYLKSISGIVKLALIGALFITLICACIRCYSYRIFFLLVSLFGIICETCFYLFYLLNLTGKVSLNWPFVDFLISAVMAALSFINFCVACAFANRNPQDGAAAFFWLVALILFCVDCYYCYSGWRGGSPRTAAPATAQTFTNQPAPATSYPAYSADTMPNYEYSN